MDRIGKSPKQRSGRRFRLAFEPLEDRSLLAVVSFALNLYQDDGGEPGVPLVDDTVEVGQTFFAQIVAREHHPGLSGLGAVSLDIAWDADVLKMVEPFDPRDVVTPKLPLFVGGRLLQEDSDIRPFVVAGQIRQNVGTIDGLGGSAFEAWGVGQPIGSDGDDRFVKPQFLGYSSTDDHFAWLHFRAEQAGEALFTMRQGGLGIATFPVMSLSSKQLHFESQIVTVVEVPEVPTEPVAVPQVPAVTDSLITTSDDPGPPSQAAPPMISVTVEPALQGEPLSARENTPPPSAPVWHNANHPVDVDGTGRVRPLDALIIANHLNISFGNWQLPPVQFTPPRYLDVNGDGRATPHDALLVVNHIESRKMPEAEGEAEPLHASEVSETTPVSQRPDQVDAAVRDAVLTPGTPRSALREGVSHRASRPVSERPDHVDTVFRDAARQAGSGRDAEPWHQTSPNGRSATDTVLRARRVSLASWSEIEDILPVLTADWLRRA